MQDRRVDDVQGYMHNIKFDVPSEVEVIGKACTVLLLSLNVNDNTKPSTITQKQLYTANAVVQLGKYNRSFAF